MRSSTESNLLNPRPRLSLEQRLTRAWQRDSLWLKLLLPLSWVFAALSGMRRRYLQARHQGDLYAAPVIVVGNISVGGSGKTPLIVALIAALKQRGYKPGVVSRGYGGKPAYYPLAVTSQTDVSQSGDEPLLIAQLTGCPVVVDLNRAAAVDYLLENYACDVVLSDDGLQHYRLHRDIEIVVVDGQRGLGNRRRLPAGPLRECAGRLSQADYVILNMGANSSTKAGSIEAQLGYFADSVDVMAIAARQFTQLCSGESVPIEVWLQAREGTPAHAVAAIGNPQRFAETLRALGLQVDLRSFDDHQWLTDAELCFADDWPVIITAKDAVKLTASGSDQLSENIWVLDIEAQLPQDFVERLAIQIDAVAAGIEIAQV